jgi:hypothetical protein
MIWGGYRLLSAVRILMQATSSLKDLPTRLHFFPFFLFSCEGVDQNQSLDELLK